jgi:hypothetical protein
MTPMRFLLLAALISGPALTSSSSVWEMSSFTDFIAGKMDGVALSRDGHITVAPQLDTVFDSGQPVIWSVVPDPTAAGAVYAATGHRGRVYHIDSKAVDSKGAATLVWTADRPEVFALAVSPQGDVYAASSPNGKIYRIRAGQATEYFDPKARYIWSLALAADGTLFAGTGDDGVVYRITGAGQGEQYYATGQGNVTGLMLDPQGRLLAGTEPNGILYRITAKDKAFALYDSTLPEVRALAATADGTIYAAGLGGALAKKIQATQQNQNTQQDTVPTISTTVTVTAQAGGGDLKPAPTEVKPQPQSPATPQSTTPAVTEATGVEKSAIYRINPDNTVDTLWSSKEENVYDILPAADSQLYFGTDQNARIYRLTSDHKLTLIAQTNDGEIVRLMRLNDAILAATANIGKLYRLGAAGTKGTFESPVFDAGSVGRWGRISWRGEGVSLQTRSGNSLRPDNSWSDWSTASSDAAGAPVASPNARYLQYRAVLAGAAAHLDSTTAAYLPQNNPPVIHSITFSQQAPPAAAAAKPAGSATTASTFSISVTDTGDAGPVASTGTPTQTLSRAIIQQLLISWQADDPDSDRLVYDVAFRGEGENDWKVLRRDLHDSSFALDGDSLADGRYLFRVTTSDRESNPAGAAKEAELVSSPVLIDNTPPVIHVQSSTRNGNAADIAFDAQDTASLLRRAEWSLDAGDWMAVAPVDGILDSLSEQFRLHLTNLPPGEHVVVLRVADSGGNTGLAKVVLH